MKIVFSRKGFDTGSGGGASPVVDGRPVSLPIPERRGRGIPYGALGLGDAVAAASRGRVTADDPCHLDPMFENGRCAFGQAGAAQAHLANRGVGAGDVFLFFGLFETPGTRERHHRIFGALEVEEVVPLGPAPDAAGQPHGFTRRHPHTEGHWPAANALYLGRGTLARTAPDALRLTRPGGPLCHWRVPDWLREAGLSYHAHPDRWSEPGILRSVSRGQEFVCDAGDRPEARDWLAAMLGRIAAAG